MNDKLWKEVVREAQRHGISGGEYIREAILARIFYERGREREPRMARAIEIAKIRESKK